MNVRGASPEPAALRELLNKDLVVGMLLSILVLLGALAQIGFTLYGDYHLLDAVLHPGEGGKLAAWAKYNRITQAIMAWTVLHALIVQPWYYVAQLFFIVNVDRSVFVAVGGLVSGFYFGAMYLLSRAMLGNWRVRFSLHARVLIAVGLVAHAVFTLLVGALGVVALGFAVFIAADLATPSSPISPCGTRCLRG